MIIEEVQSLLPTGFSDNSRVWIYQSSRAFIEKEQLEINEQLEQFYTQWTAHGAAVKGWAKILFGQFIVVMADETGMAVSGCSTDSSVKIIKSIIEVHLIWPHYCDWQNSYRIVQNIPSKSETKKVLQFLY